MWKFLSAVIDTVLPARCPFTGNMVEFHGAVSPDAWKNLRFIADPCCSTCGAPFDFAPSVSSSLSGNGAVCALCLKDPPDYSQARSVLAYNDASRDFILGFKHGDQCHAVVAMTPWLKKAGACLLKDADMLMPVPLHRWRLLKRRYNQSALMAQDLAKSCGVPCIPDILVRKKSTPPQGHLDIQNRKDNVRRAFVLKRGYDISGKKIVLVDDVYTTGATVNECARVLLKGGAEEVRVLTFAKVVKAG